LCLNHEKLLKISIQRMLWIAFCWFSGA
jgi:hypothetical protein